MKKTYVIDTNVLIQAPYALQCFEDNDLVIPLVVVEELDGLKKAEGDKGANARAVVRQLEAYRQQGDLLEGIQLELGGILRIEKNFVNVELPPDLPEDKNDNRILKVCAGLQEKQKDTTIILVTKDLVLRADQSNRKTLLGRVSGKKIIPLTYKKSKPYGISPRNLGQYFMQEALMTDAEEAPLVIIKGVAGTAKTFYSLAVGMEKVYNNPNGEYRRIVICRPNAQFDDDIGFLPGDEKEKIAPLMRPVIDNLEQILDSDESKRYEDECERSVLAMDAVKRL